MLYLKFLDLIGFNNSFQMVNNIIDNVKFKTEPKDNNLGQIYKKLLLYYLIRVGG